MVFLSSLSFRGSSSSSAAASSSSASSTTTLSSSSSDAASLSKSAAAKRRNKQKDEDVEAKPSTPSRTNSSSSNGENQPPQGYFSSLFSMTPSRPRQSPVKPKQKKPASVLTPSGRPLQQALPALNRQRHASPSRRKAQQQQPLLGARKGTSRKRGSAGGGAYITCCRVVSVMLLMLFGLVGWLTYYILSPTPSPQQQLMLRGAAEQQPPQKERNGPMSALKTKANLFLDSTFVGGMLHKRGSRKLPDFVPVQRSVPLSDRYITLWLNQVHDWFEYGRNNETLPHDVRHEKRQQIREFLSQARMAGFISVMGDIPWEWTEHAAQGQVELNSFGKDWMKLACEMEMEVHVVITLKQAPQWLLTTMGAGATTHLFEYGVALEQEFSGIRKTPSLAHPIVWTMVQSFVRKTTQLLLEEYGTCIKTISPTLNGQDLQTRYAVENHAMQDYSRAAISNFREWLVVHGKVASEKEAYMPPRFTAYSICQPLLDERSWEWIGFREEVLAKRYSELCQAVQESTLVKEEDNMMFKASCLLHFGDMFATQTDLLHSNAFFQLASSPYVDEIIMDSNMNIGGAPGSPSVVGILASVAQGYGKVVHYQADTAASIPCSQQGQLQESEQKDELVALGKDPSRWESGAGLLMSKGVEHALNAGIQGLGVTNLCKPEKAMELFQHLKSKNIEGSADDADDNGDNSDEKDAAALASLRSVSAHLNTALPFAPTAIIFVPYRAFYAWKGIVSGGPCDSYGIPPCWHESLASLPWEDKELEEELRSSHKGKCPVDVAQDALVQLWDDLRTRHGQVAVIAEPEKLTPELLEAATERVLVTFPCIMEGNWRFYQGAQLKHAFFEKTREYPFAEHVLSKLSRGPCPAAAAVPPRETIEAPPEDQQQEDGELQKDQEPMLVPDSLQQFQQQQQQQQGGTPQQPSPPFSTAT